MNLLIIQARMGSERLPGKVLKNINGKPMLEILLHRILKSKYIDKIIVATTANEIDEAIVSICKKNNIDFFRGSENDVLDRFYQAAIQQQMTNDQLQTIIRITADCPLHHHEVIDFCIDEFYRQKADYFSNSNHPPVLEDGCDTEIFAFSVLETAWKEAKRKSEREHVTPYIKNSGKFKCAYNKFHSGYNFKLSVDNENDFKTVSEIFRHFHPNEMFTINDIVNLVKIDSQFLNFNKSSVINEGYKKSVKNE